MAFVLGIIPARGGSKGIPNKNLKELNGKPLLAYTLDAAKNSNALSDYIISTDSESIAECAERHGFVVGALRPPELATDTAKSIDVAIYEIKKYELEKNIQVDYIVWLQPTAPLRQAKDIDDAYKIMMQTQADSLISVYEAGTIHPNIMYYLDDNDRLEPVVKEGNKMLRRQEFKPVYVRNGSIYMAKRKQIMEGKSFVCEKPAYYIMPRERSVNIDEPFDLEYAEWMISRHG